MHSSLQSFRAKLDAGVPVRAIMFGDSITFGSQIDPERDESIVYHKQWHDNLSKRFPKARLSIENRGVPGHKIGDAHDRLPAEVLARPADLVVVEFGINDCWDGPEKLHEFRAELQRLVDRIRTGCESATVLLTVNMLNHEWSEESVKLAHFAERTAAAQNAGWTTLYMNAIRDVAHESDTPLADGYANWEAARAAGRDTDLLLANRANHPNAEGHRLIADAMLSLFGETSA